MSKQVNNKAISSVSEVQPEINPADILTLSELAERLKVSEQWVFAKTRRRCADPLPFIRCGRYLRFKWSDVSAWLSARQAGGAV
jgi:excisionase family DNA binding protein